MKNIVFVGGGTLGHIYPSVHVINLIKKKYPLCTIYYITTKKELDQKTLKNNKDINEVYSFDSNGFKRKLSISNLLTLYKLMFCYLKIKKLLKKLKPEIVIGMGGYITGSAILAAHKLKIKTVIHEQNAVLGFTNNYLKKMVNKVLLSFNINNIENSVVVGNPRITEYKENYQQYNTFEEDKRILFVSGSLGAKIINDLAISVKKDLLKQNFRVTIVTGEKYYDDNVETIKEIIEENFQIVPFVRNLSNLLIQSSVIVSRSGATTISEILGLEKISILIPSPNVTNNHQLLNAQKIVGQGMAYMIEESQLNKKTLLEKIKILAEDKKIRKEIKNNIKANALDNSSYLFLSEIEKVI